MATTEDITIRITVDDDGAVRVLGQTGEELEKLGSKTEKAATGFTRFQAALIATNQALEVGKRAFAFLTNELDRAAKVDGVTKAFTSMQGGAVEATISLDNLNTATQGLIPNFDLMAQANQAVSLGIPTDEFTELAEAAVKLGEKVGRDAVDSIESLIGAVGRSSPLLLDNLGIKLKAAEAEESYAKILKKSTEDLTAQEKAMAFQQAAMAAIREESKKLGEAQDSAAKEFVRLTKSVVDVTDAIRTFFANSKTLESVLKTISGIVRDVAKDWELLNQAIAGNPLAIARRDLQEMERELAKLEARQYGGSGSWFSNTAEEAKVLKNNIKVLKEEIARLEATQVKQTTVAAAEAAAMNEVAKAIARTTKETKELAIEAPKIVGGNRLDGGDVGGVFKTIFGDLFGDNVSTGIEEQIGANIAKAIGSAVANIDPSDIRGSIAGSGAAVGQAIGQGIGTAIGGPAGGAIGTAVGDHIVGDIFESVSKIGESTSSSLAGALDAGVLGGFSTLGFGDKIVSALGIGGKSASSIARDKADAFFEDLLDANRVSLVINGQLREIKDLAENDFEGFFESLDTSTETGLAQFGGFDAIGRALETQLGVADDISGQIGAILGNNVGGSLNNLQILFQELGISQENLAAGIEEAWLADDISASKFLETQRQIENLYAKGIPDGIGRTDLAFQNLVESGGAGRQVVDALGDAAIEAQEKGITTLEGLKDELIASGADAEKVSQAFNAIAAAGITTLDGLADVSVQSAAVISSQLESTGTFFEDVTASLEDIQNRLNSLEDKEINITYNVRTNVDEATRELGLGGDLPGADLQQGAVQ